MSGERGGRGARGGDRNRRMFATIQSTLGSQPGASRGGRRPQREQPQDPVEPVDSLDELIAQVADMSRNIASSAHLDRMSEEEWKEFCSVLIKCAMDESERDFLVDVFSTLLGRAEFCSCMCVEMQAGSNAYVFEQEDHPVATAFPAFLGSILIAHWPRQHAKAIYEANPLLYTAVSILKGWLEIVAQDEDDEDEVDVEMVNRCATGVHEMCASTARSLWIKWPTLCDEIYAAIKPAITHSSVIEGDTKAALLHSFIQLHQWTQSRAVTTKTAQTQTHD